MKWLFAVTGLHDLDEYVQAQLILAALAIVSATLRRGGTFVAKIFRGRDISILYSQLKILFRDVTVAKPKSSRNSSIESFVVCQNYSPPEGLNPSTIQQLLEVGDYLSVVTQEMSQEIRQSVPFLACGDLRGWDSDASYALPCPDYKTLNAVQPPIAPPYKEVLERMKHTSIK
jgi:tRNA (cytidine32/guanosine34-2'-O)-methyltransferase